MNSLPDSKPLISMLLVEDEQFALDSLAIISAKKYPDVEIHTASNGRIGLDRFEAHLPDIVITDINMPEMNGIQMAENIRAIKPDTKLIAVTGSVGELVVQEAAKNGFEFDHFITKPVDFSELFAAVEQCIREI